MTQRNSSIFRLPFLSSQAVYKGFDPDLRRWPRGSQVQFNRGYGSGLRALRCRSGFTRFLSAVRLRVRMTGRYVLGAKS